MPSEDKKPHFRVSPHILQPLGLEQLQDPGLAVLELIKNSCDADAPDVTVVVSDGGATSSITVEDSGIGMSRPDFENHWLVLGDTHKRQNPITDKGRPVIGEKGLGRLACFALGSHLRITSKREGHEAFSGVVDWNAILEAASLDAVTVPITAANRGVGTTVAVQQLNRNWREQDTELLVRHVEFLAIPPAKDKFVVHLRINGKSQTIQTRPDVLEQLTEAELEVKIGRDGTPSVTKATVGSTSY